MEKGLNICMISRVVFWHGIHGGMDIHGKTLSEGLTELGHSVSVISTRHPDGKTFENRNGVNIYYLKDTRFGSRRYGWSRQCQKKIVELNNQKPFDVVWSQSFDAFGVVDFIRKKMNIPVVAILHGCINQEIGSFISNFRYHMGDPLKIVKAFVGLLMTYFVVQRAVINHCNKIITVSQAVYNSFKAIYGIGFEKKAATIPNGVDTFRFSPDSSSKKGLRLRYKTNPNDAVLLAIGRITKEKGCDIAINALHLLLQENYPVKLLIVGTGEYISNLKQMAARLNLTGKVVFTGFIDHTGIVELYRAADIVLNPTITAEGLPMVILEAMACGKPVIASDIGGINSVIHHGDNGFLVPPGKDKLLAEKIKIMMNNPKLKMNMACKARKTIEDQYSHDKMIAKTLQVFQKAVSH